MNSECDNNSLMYYVGGLVQMSYEINSGCLKTQLVKALWEKIQIEDVYVKVKHNLTKPCRSRELNKK
jgi:hypothetical protein